MTWFSGINKIETLIIEGLLSGGKERRIYEGKLYELFFYFIKQGAQKHNLSEDDAASAYSDTIISVVKNILTNKFEGRSSLKSYTYRIYENKCIDLFRKNTTIKNINPAESVESLIDKLPDDAKSAVQQVIEKNERSFLEQIIMSLGDKCTLILLYFRDGYSDKEIAGILNYASDDVVKTSRLRCLEKLRNYNRKV